MHLTFLTYLCVYLVLVFHIAIAQTFPNSTTVPDTQATPTQTPITTTIEPPINQTPTSTSTPTPPESSPIIITENTTAPSSPITDAITPETPITPDSSPSSSSPIITEQTVSKHPFHITSPTFLSIAHSPYSMQTILLLRSILTKMHIQRFLPNIPNGSLRNPNPQFMFRISKRLWYWWWCNILLILFNNPAI